MNNAAINIQCTSFGVDLCFHFSWVYMPWRGIAGSHGNPVLNLLSSCQTVLQIPPSNMKAPLSPHPHQHLLLSLWLMVVGVKWYLNVVLVCISLIIMMLSTFSCVLLYIFLEKCLFRSITCVFIIVLWVFLYILDTSSFSHIWFLIIFLHSAGYLFTFLIMSFVAQVFSSDVVQFIFFVFVVCNVFDVISKKPFPNLRHDYFYLHFLPRVL